jgi:hypothetical protein
MTKTCRCTGCESSECTAGDKGNILGVFTKKTCDRYTESYSRRQNEGDGTPSDMKNNSKRKNAKLNYTNQYCSFCIEHVSPTKAKVL